MTTPAYALSDFDVNGIIVQARPIGWDGEDVDGYGTDANGNSVYPNIWVTTCPFCGNMIEVQKDQIFVSNDDVEFCIKCDNCESGRPLKNYQFGKKLDVSDTAVFLDPIEAGLFTIEHDSKLLKQLDKELAESL